MTGAQRIVRLLEKNRSDIARGVGISEEELGRWSRGHPLTWDGEKRLLGYARMELARLEFAIKFFEAGEYAATAPRRSALTKQWRAQVLDRDNHACRRCGQTENLHAHHVVPWSEDPQLRFEVEGGETLCRDCHTEEHPELAQLYQGDTDERA